MKCVTVPTTTNPGPCKPCTHPFEYLIEQVYLSLLNNQTNSTYDEILDRILDKGIIFPNCNYCCPDCEGVYALASVERFLLFAEVVGFTTPPPIIAIDPAGAVPPRRTFGNTEGGLECCSNLYASIETQLKYAEGMGFTQLGVITLSPKGASLDNGTDNPFVEQCCNGFPTCVDDLTCWITKNSSFGARDIDRLLDKGIVEYGSIENNCTKDVSSSICKLVELFDKYQIDNVTNSFNIVSRKTVTRGDFIDRVLDKGLVISCTADGSMQISSIETWLKFAEASGYTPTDPIPAIFSTTTTTSL